MKGLLGAIQFLTRVPIRLSEPPELARCVPWFPLVGGVIGLAVGGVAAGLAELVPMAVAAAVAIIAGVMITGAFHEDGLADTADAFGGGWTREQRLRILGDPLHGSYGVAALCGTIVVRILCCRVPGARRRVRRSRRRPHARPGGGRRGDGGVPVGDRRRPRCRLRVGVVAPAARSSAS